MACSDGPNRGGGGGGGDRGLVRLLRRRRFFGGILHFVLVLVHLFVREHLYVDARLSELFHLRHGGGEPVR
jgi:hypothetical protein